ncbi:MAG: hypothetical protein Q4E99_06705, partial [Bacillota bacterium]|nr:hypothetical protein [Bacillota bacterium]
AGDAAVYFSFKQPSDLDEKLESILSLSYQQRDSLIQKQRLRLSNYSWKKSAEQVYNIYKSVI